MAAPVLLLAVAPAARAQGSGSGFLFKQPVGSFTIRAGYTHPTAGGDLFDFVTDQLTLDKGDFSGLTFGAAAAITLSERLDAVISADYASTSQSSEYRRLVDQNNNPINQTTDFKRVPVMASLRAYLTPRGRSVGRFAWVPSKVAPYVGAGGGAVWYKFHQQGDFVDINTNAIFPGDFTSSSWAPAAQGFVGVDYSLTPRIALNAEGKYLWAKGDVNQSYTGFDKIDLSAFTATLGIFFRF
jgi:opacity protein-like surface antigen